MNSPFFAVLLLVSARLFADAPHLAVPDDWKHLVFDSRVIVSATNARLAPGTMVKDAGNPLMHTDQPWFPGFQIIRLRLCHATG